MNPCPYNCGNKSSSGYCASTVCVNPKYQVANAVTSLSVSQRESPTTNADRIRAMTDEELQDWYCIGRDCSRCGYSNLRDGWNCTMLDWLKQEVNDESN